MSLPAGARLGPYEILGTLGTGGMGEVYRARDTRLGREVALKVLPRDVLDDPQRRARFEREAQTLASLNHPHIATIHDVVEDGEQRGIVMELVAGRTLAQVMAAGSIPPRVALGHAIEICDALAAAHAAGVIHRDLKPANVVITGAGAAKVLDFGIARVVAPAGPEGTDRTTMAALTGDHALVGTAAYMSPEQARGHAVDARSDIFSLGVLLHEMISGRRAFVGDSTAGVLSAVLRDDPPPLRALAPGVARGVERVTMRCLQKDPRQRYQTASDLKIALEDARDDLVTSAGAEAAPQVLAAAGTTRGRAARRVLTRLGYVTAGATIGVAGLVAAGAFQSASVPPPRYRPFVTEAIGARWPAWSPDGRTLAYLASVEGSRQLFVRGLDATQPVQLTRGPSLGDARPAWAPDGSRIHFVRDGQLVSVGVAGGEPQVLAPNASRRDPAVSVSPDGSVIAFTAGEAGDYAIRTLDTRTREVRPLEREGLPSPIVNVTDLAFSPAGSILSASVSTATQGSAPGVWLIPWPTGSPRHVLAGAPTGTRNQGFSWMPDGRRIVFNGSPEHGSASSLFIGDTATGSFHQVTAGAGTEMMPSASPDGARIAFVSTLRGMDLLELPLDGGPPVPVLQSSRDEGFPDVSASGVLAYVTDATGWAQVRVRASSDAWSRLVGPERHEDTESLQQVRWSPDGQRVSLDVFRRDHHAIWVYAAAGGPGVRPDRESTDQHASCWSPDGNWLAYRRLFNNRWELVKTPLGGGTSVRLADADGGGVGGGGATDWSPSGAWIAHQRAGGVHLVSPDGTATRVLAGPLTTALRFSRDGSRLLAVRRGESRRWELATWDVASARAARVVVLPLPASADVEGLTLSPDGSRIIVGVGTPTSDVWLLEEFEPPAPWWGRWLRR